MRPKSNRASRERGVQPKTTTWECGPSNAKSQFLSEVKNN